MRTLFRGGVVFDGSGAPLADGDLVIKSAFSGGFFSPTDDPMHPHFAQDELDQIVRTAADLERPVMAHAHSPESIKRAVRAGVRSIEHGTYLDQESAEMMVERGTWLVPTLTAGDTTEELAKDPKLAPEIRAKFEGLGRPEFDAMRLAAEAGIKVAMGTDCPVAPHGWNLNELTHMAANGFTPAEALVGRPRAPRSSWACRASSGRSLPARSRTWSWWTGIRSSSRS